MNENPRAWIAAQADAMAAHASTAALDALRAALAQSPDDYVLVEER